MKVAHALLLGLLPACAVVPSPAAPESETGGAHVDLVVGETHFTDHNFDPDEQDTLGFVVSWIPESGGFGGEFGFFHMDDERTFGDNDRYKEESKNNELFAGVRCTLGQRRDALRPYLAGGISYIESENEFRVHLEEIDYDYKGSSDDESFGVYLTLGLHALVVRNVTLGAHYRVLTSTDADLWAAVSDLDYDQVGVSIGFGF